MAVTRGKPGICSVCAHADRVKIDHQLAAGARYSALAEQYEGVSKHSLARHDKNHISASFRRAVKAGPFASEAELARIHNQSSTSVLEGLHMVYRGLAARWLVALEAGDDAKCVSISGRIHENLALTARVNREIAPAANLTINNFIATDRFRSAMLELAQTSPEVREKVVRIVRDMEAQEAQFRDVTPGKALAHEPA